jgi:hypothetical protein
MRKNTKFAIAVALLMSAMIYWGTSDATKADKTSLASYSVSSGLVIQSMQPVW